MCDPATMATMASFMGGATATGATAAAATAGTIGSTLQTIGLVTSIAAPLVGGAMEARSMRQQANMIEDQKRQDAQLNAIEDQRTRSEYMSAIRKQSAQLGARGLDLGSPTAVFLGQSAAEEMAFASQAVRQKGASHQTELTNNQILLRSGAKRSLATGAFKAAGNFLTGAPDVWPELLK